MHTLPIRKPGLWSRFSLLEIQYLRKINPITITHAIASRSGHGIIYIRSDFLMEWQLQKDFVAFWLQ